MLRKWRSASDDPPPAGPRFNEAGARMLRKCIYPGLLQTAENTASMRPEHGCSGNGAIASSSPSRARTASMRPEHGCSGNGDCQGAIFAGNIRFNEAGARMLRKWGRNNHLLTLERIRFNEAGARMLRKCYAIDPLFDAALQASMRPEHGCSGNAHTLNEETTMKDALQ